MRDNKFGDYHHSCKFGGYLKGFYNFLGVKLMGIANKIQGFFEPHEDWPLQTLVQFKRQRQIQALWIGILAFLLPIFLYYGHRTADCFRDTISHSYYLPFWGDFFVALTCFVGLFLMFYRGQSQPERYLAVFGGLCAVMVAMNPTNGSGCDDMFAQSRIFFNSHDDLVVTSAFPVETFRGNFHLGSAVLLFITLAIFNLFVFTATDKNNDYQTKQDNRNKRIRNFIYKACGWLMITTIAILAIGMTAGFTHCDAFSKDDGIVKITRTCTEARFESTFWDDHNLTFYFEWLGLALFGAAWFVKGRGGGFLLLDETPDQIISKPWWWPLWGRNQNL
ncbi:hypothetical protein N9M66_04220 [Litoreibacter sp.]|nr:hypothetical protein [Litoreibacter sp.]